MLRAFRLAGPLAALAIGAAALAGCTAPGLILTAAGIATDTSMTWEMAKHVHAQLTEDDPTPCALLNSVQRALNGRCEFVPGSIRTRRHRQERPAGLPAHRRDAGRAPLARPARADREGRAATSAAPRSPLQDLAEVDACPNFQSASPEILKAIVYLADNDPRSVRHDVFRMLSCTSARAVGLDQVLVGWLDRGKLQPGTLSFSPLEALDPDLLVTRFGRELEVAGHLAAAPRSITTTAACRWASRKRSARATGPPSNGGSTSCRSSPTGRRRAAARRWPGCRCSACCCPATSSIRTTQADMVRFLHGARRRSAHQAARSIRART